MSVALAPLQIATVAGEIAAVGSEFTVTNLDAVAEHPTPLVTVTEKVVLDVGLTVML